MKRDSMRLPAAAALAALALLAAGCGGPSAPSVARLATTTGSTQPAAAPGTTAKPGAAALAACFEAHGFSASVGGNGGSNALTVAGVTVEGANPGSALFRAAMSACRKYLPGGGPPALSQAELAKAARALVAFATCMRRSGVPDFPDPTSDDTFPLSAISKLDLSSPLLLRAYAACRSLEPKVGPRIQFEPGGVAERL